MNDASLWLIAAVLLAGAELVVPGVFLIFLGIAAGIVAGAALKGPADRMLTELGHEPSVVGVARLYAPICGTLVIDEQDADRVAEVEACGVRCVVTDTIMKTPAVARALALTALENIG